MKNFRFWAALLLFAAPVALLHGCGGGGSGGGGSAPSPTASPTFAPTPTVGARVLVVQLRDRGGNPVDGIVSIGTAPVAGTSIQATSGGAATFNRNVAAGTTPVSAEVDGETTRGSIVVKVSGTIIYTLTVAPQVSPAPTTTVPPPPFPA